MSDVFAGVNGEGVIIKRGSHVKVKRKYLDVIDQSERQDILVAEAAEQKAREFEEASRQRNI